MEQTLKPQMSRAQNVNRTCDAPRGARLAFRTKITFRSRSGSLTKLGTCGADLVANRAEGRIGAGAQSGDRHEANHDDQGQHDGVFNGRRAVFRVQELDYELTKLAHRTFPFGYRRNTQNHPTIHVTGSPHRPLTSIP